MTPGLRVVYVDDDRRALRTLERGLREYRSEWNMDFVDNGTTALEFLEADEDRVLITDWMMPGIDGLGLCRVIRERESEHLGGYTYILLLTGKQEITSIVQALEAGADDFLSKPYDLRELVARIRAGARIVQLQRRLRESNDRLAVLATTDALTGLFNRRRGREILDEQLDLLQRGKQDLSVVVVDLDRFKSVNDTYGHEAGDTLICCVAKRLRDACRMYDSVIRWGGDEFIVVCPHTSGVEISSLAERIRAAVASEPVSLDHATAINVTISIGTSSAASGSAIDAQALLAGADAALYEAKASGRNCVQSQLL